jgi:predicted O-methyltransferase YrrM
MISRLNREKIIGTVYESLSARLKTYSGILEARLAAQRFSAAGLGPAKSIHSDMGTAELQSLYELASCCPPAAKGLEIGSHLGKSACYLAAGLSKVYGHLYCVDTWDNETMPDGRRDTFTDFLTNTRAFQHMITPLRMRSSELSVEDMTPPLDIIFIDADHSYSAVKADFSRANEWLVSDGVIILHDFASEHFEGVSRVVGEALASGQWIMSGFVETLVWIKRAKWSKPSWVS